MTNKSEFTGRMPTSRLKPLTTSQRNALTTLRNLPFDPVVPETPGVYDGSSLYRQQEWKRRMLRGRWDLSGSVPVFRRGPS